MYQTVSHFSLLLTFKHVTTLHLFVELINLKLPTDTNCFSLYSVIRSTWMYLVIFPYNLPTFMTVVDGHMWGICLTSPTHSSFAVGAEYGLLFCYRSPTPMEQRKTSHLCG